MKKLENISHILMIIAALVFIGETISDHMKNKSDSQLVASRQQAQHVSFDALSAEKPTLILAMSSHCHFCIASAPFYQMLSSAHGAGKTSVKFVVVSPETLTTIQAFLREHQITVDQVVSKPLEELGVQGTPALLLVKQNGNIERRWDGQLDSVGQKQVFAAIE